MAEIRIEGNTAFAFGDHLYLVFADDAGSEFVIRGGPTPGLGFGNIITESGVPIAASEDFRPVEDRDDFGSRVINLGGRDANDVWNTMVRASELINGAGINYDLFGPNSNSTVASVLYTVGIDVNEVQPNLPGIDFFPGINDDLLDEYARILTEAHTSDGNDVLRGGSLADSFEGGRGNDSIDGGEGDDEAVFSGDCLEYDLTRNGDGTITVTHARPASDTINDGTDTLINVEIARFAEGKEIDLTAAEVHGCTLLRPEQDFFTTTTDNGLVLLNWFREGDLSYAIDILNDGTVLRPEGIAFFDAVLTYPAGEETAEVGGVNLNSFRGFPEDVLVEVKYSVSPDDSPIADLVTFETDTVRYLFIGDGIDDRGGRTWGDPHLITFDNVAFDFQAAGEFVLARANSGPAYEVQARFVSLSSAVSVTQAVATTVDGITISIEADGGDGSLLVGGIDTAVVDGTSISVGSGSITRTGQTIEIDHGNGDVTSVDVFGTFLNASPQPSETRDPGSIEGLLGNANGTPADDFQLADGTVLTTPLPVETLYGDFAASWAVSGGDRLLPGDPEAFDAPDRIITIDSLPDALRTAAEAAVDARGITNPIVREAAILDFALTGNAEFIDAAALTDLAFDPIVDTVSVDPVSSPVVILTSDRNVLDEEDPDGRTATFTVSRGSNEGDLTLSYAIAGVGASAANGDDFVPGAASGEVTILDGQDTATFEIEVADDDLDEGPENFDVVIDIEGEDASAFELLVSSVRMTIEDDDDDLPPPPPPPPPFDDILGTEGSDDLVGTDADDVIRSLGGQGDRMEGGLGNDQFVFGSETSNGVRERDLILDYEVGRDAILLEEGAAVESIQEKGDSVLVFLEGDRDTIFVRGEGVNADNLTFLTEDEFEVA